MFVSDEESIPGAPSTVFIDNEGNPTKSIRSVLASVDLTKIKSLEEWVKNINKNTLDDVGNPVKMETRYRMVDGVQFAISAVPVQQKSYTEINFIYRGQFRWIDIGNLSATTTDHIANSLHFF